MISIVVPTLNEASQIESFLLKLQYLRKNGHELIIVDGGSQDSTLSIAQQFVDDIVSCEPCRAEQMNAGAAMARGDILWFLHADSYPPPCADRLITKGLQEQPRVWGRFNVRLSGSSSLFRIIEFMMNVRSCFTGIATGDQGIFVKRSVFFNHNGFPKIALMEDVAISKKFKKISRPLCVTEPIVTSSRKWESDGIFRTIVTMWLLRIAYWIGINPDRLKNIYYPSDS